MSVKLLRQARNLSGKRVLVRVDFNVPIKKGKVLDNTRILASLLTIRHLMRKKAKIILITHIGRPEGKVVSSLKVDPVVRELSRLLGKKVKKFNTGNWKLTDKQKLKIVRDIDKMKAGQVAIMENIRFSKDEKKNTGKLSQELANLADLFVLDGFAVAHRGSASVSGIPKYVVSCAGILLEREMKGLNKVIKKPKKPFVAILGGAKVETKIPVMKNLLPKVNHILLGGVLFNTYLKAKGYKVGSSLVDSRLAKQALEYCKKRKVVLPTDVVVGSKDGKHYRVVDIKRTPHFVCKKDEAIFDIGPETIHEFSVFIKKAQTIVWNGAMGYFEQDPYSVGTFAIARLVATRSKGFAYGVVGGGETLESVSKVDMTDFIDLVSTGGGAMLEYLAGNKLPGIEALK